MTTYTMADGTGTVEVNDALICYQHEGTIEDKEVLYLHMSNRDILTVNKPAN